MIPLRPCAKCGRSFAGPCSGSQCFLSVGSGRSGRASESCIPPPVPKHQTRRLDSISPSTLMSSRTVNIPDVQTLFKRHFGSTPTHVVKAPGRLELLGNHTDYNEGLVMSLAVNRYIHMVSSSRIDGKIELVSSAFPERESFWANDLSKSERAPWANYVKGVLDQLRKRGVGFNGFNAAIFGDIPMGAGMSSSAAIEVATALTI